MNKVLERVYNGLLKENPTFVLILGMCPTLAVTTSAVNGLGMGLTTTVVLIMSNFLISLLRRIIPDGVRIPAFIVIIATFVTVIQLLLEGYLPSLYEALGIYIPLIVVNCIILGRAEAYASKNNVLLSVFDGLGMGLGFTLGLTLIGIVRELLGAGTVFGAQVMPASYEPLTIFIMAPGAFLVLALLIAIQNKIKLRAGKDTGKTGNCDELCEACLNTGCAGKLSGTPDGKTEQKKQVKVKKQEAKTEEINHEEEEE